MSWRFFANDDLQVNRYVYDAMRRTCERVFDGWPGQRLRRHYVTTGKDGSAHLKLCRCFRSPAYRDKARRPRTKQDIFEARVIYGSAARAD